MDMTVNGRPAYVAAKEWQNTKTGAAISSGVAAGTIGYVAGALAFDKTGTTAKTLTKYGKNSLDFVKKHTPDSVVKFASDSWAKTKSIFSGLKNSETIADATKTIKGEVSAFTKTDTYKTLDKTAKDATKKFNNALNKAKGSDIGKQVMPYYEKAKNAINEVIKNTKDTQVVKDLKTQLGKFEKQVKGLEVKNTIGKAKDWVGKQVGKLTNSETYKNVAKTVKESGVGKWAAKHPALAAGIAAATIVGAGIAIFHNNKSEKA